MRARLLGGLALVLLLSMAPSMAVSGGVALERSALALALDGRDYEIALKGVLLAPRALDLVQTREAEAWRRFVADLPRQPGYRKADQRLGGRADVEIRLKGTLTPSKPALGLPFTQEPDSPANLLTLRLMQDGTVELRLNPAAAEGVEDLRALVHAKVARGVVLAAEGAQAPQGAPQDRSQPYVWRITRADQPLRLRANPPWNFGVRDEP